MNFLEAFKEILTEMPQFELSGKTLITPEGAKLRDMKLEDVKENIVFFRNSKAGFFHEGYSLVYFLDSPASAEAMKNGEIPYLMVPRGTFGAGGSPITDVWKKKYQKPGTEHILGMIEANVMPDAIFIDMMSVRNNVQRNKINTMMVNMLKSNYPEAKISYSSPTEKGNKFIKSFAEKVDLLNTKTSDFDSKMIRKGAEVESEHTDNKKQAEKIAKQHTAEYPKEKDDKISTDYYKELDKTEGKLKKGIKKSFKEVVADLDAKKLNEDLVSGGAGSVFGSAVVGTANQFSSDSYAKGDARMPKILGAKTKKKKKTPIIRRTLVRGL